MYHLLQEYKMFIKASNNMAYWSENFVKFNDKFIKLNQMQIDINESLNSNTITKVVKSRQSGGTLFGCIASLHYAIFNPHTKVGVNSFNYSMSIEILKTIECLYKSIDIKYKPKLELVTNDKICFDNGSEILIVTPSSKSITLNMLYVDEAAFNHYWDSLFKNIFPTLAMSKCKVLTISSHNPEAFEYNKFLKAKSNKSQLLLFPWYKSHLDANKIKEIRNIMSFKSFTNEYECGGDYFIL